MFKSTNLDFQIENKKQIIIITDTLWFSRPAVAVMHSFTGTTQRRQRPKETYIFLL